MNILALEVGDGYAAAAVLGAANELIGGPARADYVVDQPCADAAEAPVSRIWQAVALAARQAVWQSGVAGKPGDDIAGVGLTASAPAPVLLGGDDSPLAPVWLPRDRRARPAARQVWAHVGDEFLATIGCWPLPAGVSAVAWRQQLTLDPYLCHRTRSYLHLGGWLGFHLTGQKAFDPANASLTGLFGTTSDGQWSSRWCEYFEVDRDWLPPVLEGDATLGSLRAAAAAELSVPAGVPVKVGVIDRSSMMLAAAMGPADLLQIEGEAETLAMLSDRPTPSRYRMTHRFGVGPGYVRLTHNPVGAAAIEWLWRLCFRDLNEAEFYGRTLAEASTRSTRLTLDPPFLSTEHFEIEAHRAAFRDLDLKSDRLDLLAALLGARVQRHREAMERLEHAGAWRRIVLVGKNSSQRQLVSSHYPGAEVHELEHAALRGVARLWRHG